MRSRTSGGIMDKRICLMLQLLFVFVQEGKFEFNNRYNYSSYPVGYGSYMFGPVREYLYICHKLCLKFSKIRFTRAGNRTLTLYLDKVGYNYPMYYLQRAMCYNLTVCYHGYSYILTGKGGDIDDLCNRLRCI